VDRIECPETARIESSRGQEKIAVHDQLVDGIEMSERHPYITVDAADGPDHFGHGQLAGHQGVIGGQIRPPGGKCTTLHLAHRKLHDRRGIEIPDVHRSSARSSARASEAGRSVSTGGGSGGVTLAGFNLPESRSRVSAPPTGGGPRTAIT